MYDKHLNRLRSGNKRRFNIIDIVTVGSMFIMSFVFVFVILFKLALLAAIVLGCIWLYMQIVGS